MADPADPASPDPQTPAAKPAQPDQTQPSQTQPDQTQPDQTQPSLAQPSLAQPSHPLPHSLALEDGRVIARNADGRVQIRRAAHGWSAAQRNRFLAILAETANVVAAAEAAGKSASSARALKRRSPAFAAAWAEALEAGYAQVEEALLAYVIASADASGGAGADASADAGAMAAGAAGPGRRPASAAARSGAAPRRHAAFDADMALRLLNAHHKDYVAAAGRTPRAAASDAETDAALLKQLAALRRRLLAEAAKGEGRHG